MNLNYKASAFTIWLVGLADFVSEDSTGCCDDGISELGVGIYRLAVGVVNPS